MSPPAPDTSVRGYLEGDERDLLAIERLFAGHDTGVEKVDGEWLVHGPELGRPVA